ncbi:DUF6169 family protein [Tenacibaculum sp. IB213877]|uniref:DUF6169 family protein n=1 Tax=Tenacibaculum sp. IB213877 TaxID=3097351 RepID=UPI002A5AF009|nr:DUF6169 family protein [Tenacibaculum sp. IB213877]MDY0781107.1 DUF6169 family protein [Tenacibaculum sp. IB213877]
MYKYTKEQGAEGPYFYFYTENNLTYYVAFRNMSQDSYPLNNLYSLDFGEIDNRKGKNDIKISSTILHIIIQFINFDQSIVLHFLCDSTDKRHLNRKRLFSRWFSISHKSNWIKYDYDFDNADYNISFLYCSDIYETQKIESEILLTLDVYERAKDE